MPTWAPGNDSIIEALGRPATSARPNLLGNQPFPLPATGVGKYPMAANNQNLGLYSMPTQQMAYANRTGGQNLGGGYTQPSFTTPNPFAPMTPSSDQSGLDFGTQNGTRNAFNGGPESNQGSSLGVNQRSSNNG